MGRLKLRRRTGEKQRPLQHIAQLTNVAGPSICHESSESVRRDRRWPSSEIAPEVREKPDRNVRDLGLSTFPKRGNAKRQDGNSVEEVFPESPDLHRLGQV